MQDSQSSVLITVAVGVLKPDSSNAVLQMYSNSTYKAIYGWKNYSVDRIYIVQITVFESGDENHVILDFGPFHSAI